MKKILNDFKFRLPAINENVNVCTTAISSFLNSYNPTIEELSDIRMAVSEAFENCIKHAYKDLPENKDGYVYISVRYHDSGEMTVEISDNGCGFKPETRRTPSFGFVVMKNFMDSVTVKSKIGKGTTILMRKALQNANSTET